MNWLGENIIPLLALLWTLFTFAVWVLFMTGHFHTDKEISILIINSITNIIMLIIGFYFGSSKGSKDKTVLIEKEMNTNLN